MANVDITISGQREVNKMLADFSKSLPKNIKKGMRNAGVILERDMKKKVSGPGRSGKTARKASPFSRLNQFPGVVSGRLRSGIRARLVATAGSVGLVVGPNVKYDKYLEFGTRKMPAYAFVGPTWKDKGNKAIDAINKEVLKPLK